MFKLPTGGFDLVPCPQYGKQGKCEVVNCVFQHGKRKLEFEDANVKRTKVGLPEVTVSRVEPEPQNMEEPAPPPKKDIGIVIPKNVVHLGVSRADRTVNVRRLAAKMKGTEATPNRLAIDKEYEIAMACNSDAEYTEKVDELLNGKRVRLVDPKYILPREVTVLPAQLATRKKYIQAIVNAIKKVDPERETPILDATDEEYQIASTTTATTYAQMLRKRLYQIAHPEKVKQVSTEVTREQFVKALDELVIPVEKLRLFGYIMDIPETVDPVEERVCRRCNNEFKLSEILRPIECHHHPGKVIRKDKNTRVYDCCGGIVGGETDACCVNPHHVFYWQSPGEMHWSIPFQNTKALFPPSKNTFAALGIDCEMGYTTRGFELLRISAVDFFSGEEVFDILVKPVGTVIDLNTKWSGIGEIKAEALTFTDAIHLLGSVMDYNTILIGHGLENDMNAMRLIHERIVDTAILYPKHKATPKFRFPLKHLTFKYLGRTIQTGEHDSTEDSIAAIDVVKYFIKQDLKPKST